MNLEMQLLFDSLKEAILIVAKTGAVLYANQPAQKILPLVIGQPLAAGWLSGQLKSIRRGYLKPPVTFEIDAPRNGAAAEQTDRLHVTLLTSPVPGDFIVVMQTTTTEQMYQNVISNLAEMLDSEFRAPMEKFLGSAADMLVRFEGQADKDWELRESVARVSRMGTELTALLQQIGLLASTYKASPMRGEDRIPVSELVADVVLGSTLLLRKRRINVSYCGLSDGLPVIYGSRNFLVQALAGYLRHLVERLDSGANILISAKPHGNFIRLAIANYEGIAPAGTEQQFLPLMAASDSKPANLLGLTLPICKRVLELNGGNLYFDKEEGKVGTITFELPVGAPANDSRQQEMKQAFRYAEDLCTLLRLDNSAPKH